MQKLFFLKKSFFQVLKEMGRNRNCTLKLLIKKMLSSGVNFSQKWGFIFSLHRFLYRCEITQVFFQIPNKVEHTNGH